MVAERTKMISFDQKEIKKTLSKYFIKKLKKGIDKKRKIRYNNQVASRGPLAQLVRATGS